MTEAPPSIEVQSGLQIGERPARSHDFVFVAEREPNRCALLIGREIRDDWEAGDPEETPAATAVLASADEVFLPVGDGTPPEQLERFTKGFRRVMNETQQGLQLGGKEREGEAPSLGLTLGYIDDRRLYIGQVGRDPSYLVRGGKMHRITAAGPERLSEGEQPLVRDPRSTGRDLEVVGGFSDDLDIRTLALMLEPGDLVLLCTHGVTAGVPEPILEEAVLATCQDEDGASLEAVADAVFELVPEKRRTVDRAVALARLPVTRNPKDDASLVRSER